MADFKYEIVEHIGTLSESAKGWTKELNRISWNGGEPKYDIRDWAPDAFIRITKIKYDNFHKVICF